MTHFNLTNNTFNWVVAWLSGSALVSISGLTLCWARLVLGWVTICGRESRLGL